MLNKLGFSRNKTDDFIEKTFLLVKTLYNWHLELLMMSILREENKL